MTEHGPIPEIDVDRAAQRLHNGAAADSPLLVDVREANELIAVHVPGSMHVPMSDLVNAAESIPTGRPLFLICASGRRSLVAAEYLRRHGHPDVANVGGGIIEWQKRGLPTGRGQLSPVGSADEPAATS